MLTLAAIALITVYCTARIYSCLKTVRAWHNAWTVPGYFLLALYSGALWAWLLSATPRSNVEYNDLLVLLGLVAISGMAAGLLKLLYWRAIDRDVSPSTPETATGLGIYGKVRSFERPHTEENYLTREMGFVVARKHAAALRLICLLLAFALPLLAMVLSQILPAPALVFPAVALLSASLGIFVERWLFFAQAKHAVMLYYGGPDAPA